MKLSEVARYWAAKELTRVERNDDRITFHAPFACPDFTVRCETALLGAPHFNTHGEAKPLKEVSDPLKLAPNTWCHAGPALTACLALPKGTSSLATP
jgi:hypothetical protein